ncbi:hypothetical protein HQQ80_13840 [Microbacteriaceae bacterium VKM Ac-2855]|nr:hypothetical protein [Microbacteriaceae bacterium VKM Ac-2855]
MTENITPAAAPSRRAVATGALWSVPAIAAAVAAPLAAASPSTIDVGAYHLDGTCGILGVIGPGFLLTAGPTTDLPIGTSILIVGSGVANIGVFAVTGGLAQVTVLSGTSRLITLTAPLAAGATLAFRTTLSISVAFTLTATATLPEDYVSTGGKAAGSVSSTLILCSAV